MLARRAQRSFERLLDALARHDHQTEVIKRKYLGRRLVTAQSFLQGLHDALAITPLYHVDQIEHDDTAQIPQPNLARNLFDRFHVRARDRVFQASSATTDELAGVDVD